MSETEFIIAEVIVGIGLLGLLSAVITAVMVPLLSRQSRAVEIVRERYAKGDLSREQYEQMRQDLTIAAPSADAFVAPTADGREPAARS